MHRRDRIVVSTLRCGRNNPGSNPGHGIDGPLFIALCTKLRIVSSVDIRTVK